VQAVARAARRAQPTYQALTAGVRASPVVAPDETGWRVGGRRAWRWAFVGDQVTVYRIAGGRGYHDAAQVLGGDYAGVLERDGWAPYRRFAHADHQTCLAHLLRRCRELVADADRGQARTPNAVRRILLRALTLRDAHHAGSVDQATLVAEADRLGAQLDKLVAGATRYPPNRRLLNHLAVEREHLFTFLRVSGVQATNWRAEQAIRPAVVTRKSWGGNRTWAGADTWQVLSSVLRTATQQARDPSSCWPACSKHQHRSWPTSPSPGTDRHTPFSIRTNQTQDSGHLAEPVDDRSAAFDVRCWDPRQDFRGSSQASGCASIADTLSSRRRRKREAR
jgi:transposase